eukprot:CAMPEP_0170510882 /NCGR_PEP_ID=MMETSP0208-20121228/66002_1 /TAXON_ID=197538 /ORGANISM="Strombidium inclinatum, Strain S3" /LENGTH=51 /DNA_ID=CAMNT_0010794375 /DNA_START=703 /DNA_END=858 /DNA_ORIENTATION=-
MSYSNSVEKLNPITAQNPTQGEVSKFKLGSKSSGEQKQGKGSKKKKEESDP